MGSNTPAATFNQVTEMEVESPTLIEGLPGHGLVAAIAVDQITNQLGLNHYGNIYSDAFPPVVTFEDGLVNDLVRVYAGNDPPVLTLESDLALPPQAFKPLSRCVLDDLATRFEQAIFLAGAPAQREEDLGTVVGVGTTAETRDALVEAGIRVAEERGLVGGVTGSLVTHCYHAGVPATLLVVHAHPFLPDPEAARSVIDTAIEPLVEFDIDTSPLDEQAEQVRRQLQRVAEQYQQMMEDGPPDQAQTMGMYQ